VIDHRLVHGAQNAIGNVCGTRDLKKMTTCMNHLSLKEKLVTWNNIDALAFISHERPRHRDEAELERGAAPRLAETSGHPVTIFS
jgi:hypothetical protein